MTYKADSSFAAPHGPWSAVWTAEPDVFGDGRGWFCEVAKERGPGEGVPPWAESLSWVKQVNRSSSRPGTVRGCHAQKGGSCQAKLVQALTAAMYDVITDARPESPTFGVSGVYVLDPAKQNQLFVPKGFLHAFVVPSKAGRDALFEYFCSEPYDRAAETGVNPLTLLPGVAGSLKSMKGGDPEYQGLFETLADGGGMKLSGKDLAAATYEDFMAGVKAEFDRTRKAWYL